MRFSQSPFQVRLSFSAIAERLEAKAAGPSPEESEKAAGLLKELESFPQFITGINSESEVQENEGLIRRLLEDYFPPALTRNEIKAVNLPYASLIFNHTERLKGILRDAGENFDMSIRDFDQHQFYVLSCCLILNEYYGTHLDFSKPLFYDIPTADGIVRHYRILYNADNLEILPTERSVPLSPQDIDELMNSYNDLALWKEKFPQESWILRGFSIMTLFDATVENAVSLLKEKLLGLNTVGFQEGISSIYRSIFRIPDIRVGFTLFNREEDSFSMEAFRHQMHSFLLQEEPECQAKELLCPGSYKCLVGERRYFAVSDTKEFAAANPKSVLARHFLKQEIHSFILAPIVKNDALLGILEVVAPRSRELNSINANKLEVVMSFLTETVERLLAELQNQVQAIIQEKYTSIHESVYWRFREEALKLVTHRQRGAEYYPNEIVFPGVYPLYGQIDIQGSSEARNSSIQKDLQHQLEALLSLLEKVSKDGTFSEEIRWVSAHLDDLGGSIKAGTEQLIGNYLESRIHYRLRRLPQSQDIYEYFAGTDHDKGAFHLYRRKYETTVATINNKLTGILDGRQLVAQALYPHYYERFKSDGVEHNLYIGQAIAPGVIFDINRLHELRLWQLQSLCEMELAHYQLKPSLPYPLNVTTLILVYQSPIAIRFRMDEKRFDVDGSYNARFEIVKKRIDKAHIRSTQERITEKGKITIVYSSEEEAEEYLGYISVLQAQGLLHTPVEQFEIEDLQGVSGLKGLRVPISHHSGSL